MKLFGALAGILGALMLASNTGISGYGYVPFLASSVAWMTAAWRARDWNLLALNVAFTAANIMGIARWMI